MWSKGNEYSKEHSSVSMGLSVTFEVLAKTRNEAAVNVLLPNLDSSQRVLQEGSLRALLDRKSLVGQHEILDRLHMLDEGLRKIIEEKPGRMSKALRDAVLGNDSQTCLNGCRAILKLREYDLIPALISALEDESNPHNALAADTLLELARLLYAELAGPRDYTRWRDPQLVRRNTLQSLEQSLKRYGNHKRVQVVESFLLLVNRDNATLKQILHDPHDAAYLPVVQLLQHSTRGGVIRLVLSFLDDPEAPRPALSALAHRVDLKFLRNLCRRIGDEPSPTAAHNLARIHNFAWAKGDPKILDELDEDEQQAAIEILMRSEMRRLDVYDTIAYLLRNGKPAGRRRAARELEHFSGADANELTIEMLSDPDPKVQAHVVAQLRPRGIPGALNQLIEHLDSPHEEVRQAARDGLAEFSFSRFIKAIDTLDEDVQRRTGALVKKVDPDTLPRLREEMASRVRSRRLRGLNVAALMDVVPDVEASVIGLLSDEDHLVRLHAAQALAQSSSETAQEALKEAQMDNSHVVQQAAKRSLLEIAQRENSHHVSAAVKTVSDEPYRQEATDE